MTDHRGKEEDQEVKRKEGRLRHRRNVQDEDEQNRGHRQGTDHRRMRD